MAALKANVRYCKDREDCRHRAPFLAREWLRDRGAVDGFIEKRGALMTDVSELRELLDGVPAPMEGPGPWQQDLDGDQAYDLSARCLAKTLLLVADENPDLLDVGDQSDLDASLNSQLWDAAKKKYPGLNDWLGGVTGFQFGWAHNLVRQIIGVEPVGNPAIWAVSETEDERTA